MQARNGIAIGSALLQTDWISHARSDKGIAC
jgi:hypothetical protein